MTTASTPSLASLADGCDQLYTLPSVALEVLRLTEQPNVDARAICECMEGDPALAAKVLRVVNSSLYGLPRQIGSLSEAIAILGVRPLKLLMLGFSLPEQLFDNLTGDALRRYWTESLTTATAARAFAEAGWRRLGDEAFVAGLMQRIGKLGIVGQLGDDYARLLDSAGGGPLKPGVSLAALERESLGFEHTALSAELIRRWRLPLRLAAAIDRQTDEGVVNLEDLEADDACLAQSLRLANLMTRLVVTRDLMALEPLLEEADRYVGLGKRQINSLVEALQERTNQVAQAMSIELTPGFDYQQTLVEAHARLSVLSENAAIGMLKTAPSAAEIEQDEQLAQQLLIDARRLGAAMQCFLAGGTEPRTDAGNSATAPGNGPHGRPAETSRAHLLKEAVEAAATDARNDREALSLCLVQLVAESTADADVGALQAWVEGSDFAAEFQSARWVLVTRDRAAVLLAGLDRVEATRLWSETANSLAAEVPLTLNAGVANVAAIPRGFEPHGLIQAAERCLTAAREVAGPAVKSIEVF